MNGTVKEISRPLTREEIAFLADSEGYVTVRVKVSCSEWNDMDDDRFEAMLSKRITNTDLMIDLQYESIEDKGTELLLEVEGDVNGIIDDDEDGHIVTTPKRTKFRESQEK